MKNKGLVIGLVLLLLVGVMGVAGAAELKTVAVILAGPETAKPGDTITLTSSAGEIEYFKLVQRQDEWKQETTVLGDAITTMSPNTKTFFSEVKYQIPANAPAGALVFEYSIQVTVQEKNNGPEVIYVGRGTKTVTIQFAATGPSIDLQPVNQSITYGANATFTAMASGNPVPAVQWQVSTDSGANWSAMASETNATLRLDAPPVSASGNQYRAVFTNSAGSVMSNPATLTVSKATATITLSNLVHTYDGKAKIATASTLPVGLQTAITYAGTDTTPSAAGTYAVVATVVDDNYAGSATGSLVINKANATVDVKGTTVTYDGQAHGASGSATGADGANLSALLNLGASFSNVPGGAATWAFAGDNNHNAASGEVGIVINKAAATIKVSGYSAEWDGKPHGAIITQATGVGDTAEDLIDYISSGQVTNWPGGTISWTFEHPNYVTQEGTVTITITDSEAPETTVALDPIAPNGQNGWYKSAVTITLSGTDPASGVKHTEYSYDGKDWHPHCEPIVHSTDGEYTLYYRSVDNALNTEKAKSTTFKIDKTAPAAPTITLDPAGWTNAAEVEVSIAPGTDTTSGVASTQFRIKSGSDGWSDWTAFGTAFGVSKEGLTKVEAKTVDKAGNVSEVASKTVQIDRTNPTIAIGGTSYVGGEIIDLGYIGKDYPKTVSYTKEDDASGFDLSGATSVATTVTIPTDVEGMALKHDLTVTDIAGNSTTITFRYNVISLDGLAEMLRPMQDGGTYNKNRTIPVKIQVVDNAGAPVALSANDLYLELRLLDSKGKEADFNRTNKKKGELDDAQFELKNEGMPGSYFQFNMDVKGTAGTAGDYTLEIRMATPAMGEELFRIGSVTFTFR